MGLFWQSLYCCPFSKYLGLPCLYSRTTQQQRPVEQQCLSTYELDAGNFHEWNELHGAAVRQLLHEIAEQVLVCPELIKFLHDTRQHVNIEVISSANPERTVCIWKELLIYLSEI